MQPLWALTQWWIATGIPHPERNCFPSLPGDREHFTPAQLDLTEFSLWPLWNSLSCKSVCGSLFACNQYGEIVLPFWQQLCSLVVRINIKLGCWRHSVMPNTCMKMLASLPDRTRTCVGLAALHPGTAKSGLPAVAARPWRAAGQSPGHPGWGQTCPPGGAGAPQRPPAPAGHLLAS